MHHLFKALFDLFKVLYAIANKHTQEFGGGIFGSLAYVFKCYITGGRIWHDIHDLIMVALSSIIGFLSVLAVRTLIQKRKQKNGKAD